MMQYNRRVGHLVAVAGSYYPGTMSCCEVIWRSSYVDEIYGSPVF